MDGDETLTHPRVVPSKACWASWTLNNKRFTRYQSIVGEEGFSDEEDEVMPQP